MRSITPADFPALLALRRRIEQHDGVPFVTTLDDFDEWVADPHLDLAADTRVIEDGDNLIAWAHIWFHPGGADLERAFLFGGVDPARRGQGIGRAILAWQIERGGALVRAIPGNPSRILRAQAYDFQAGDLALYARLGMTPVRYNDEMLRDLVELPAPVELPGIAIVPWDPAHSEAARVAQNAAFADHWGSTPRDRATWEHDLASHITRADLSFLALDGDAVVGVCRNGWFPGEEALSGRKEGWVLNVSVVASHRKRGIAAALIARSLAAFKAAGFTHSALGVDSANPTGAYGLYERLGYRPMFRLVVSQREA